MTTNIFSQSRRFLRAVTPGIQRNALVVVAAITGIAFLGGCADLENLSNALAPDIALIKTCNSLAPRIVKYSNEQKDLGQPVLLKISDIQEMSKSETGLECRGDALTSAGESGSGTDGNAISIDFYKYTDKTGEIFIGFGPADPNAISDAELASRAPKISAAPTATAFVLPTRLPPTPTPAPTPTPLPVETPAPVSVPPTVTPTSVPLPLPTPLATAVPSPTPTPTTVPGPAPTSTSVPTPTPVVHTTATPEIEIPTESIPPADFLWQGEDPINATLGITTADFTLSAVVVTPHDNGIGVWSWGVGLTAGGQTDHVYIMSDSSVRTDSLSPEVVIESRSFLVNTTQNAENTFIYRVRHGVIAVYVNGSIAANITGLWDRPGAVSVGTNYLSTSIAKGFALRTPSVTVNSSKLVRDENFDIEVRSTEENIIELDTTEFDRITASFENPFSVSHEDLDFGFRIGLPYSNRQLEIKQSNSPNDEPTFFLSLVPKSGGVIYWQKVIPLPTHRGATFDVVFTRFDGAPMLTIDRVEYVLNVPIDFSVEHFEDVEFFVNTDQRVIDSNNARFLSSPFVRITDFGMWND